MLFSKLSKSYYISKARKHESRIAFFIGWELGFASHLLLLLLKTFAFRVSFSRRFESWVPHYSPLTGGMSKAKARNGNVRPEYSSSSC